MCKTLYTITISTLICMHSINTVYSLNFAPGYWQDFFFKSVFLYFYIHDFNLHLFCYRIMAKFTADLISWFWSSVKVAIKTKRK